MIKDEGEIVDLQFEKLDQFKSPRMDEYERKENEEVFFQNGGEFKEKDDKLDKDNYDVAIFSN